MRVPVFQFVVVLFFLIVFLILVFIFLVVVGRSRSAVLQFRLPLHFLFLAGRFLLLGAAAFVAVVDVVFLLVLYFVVVVSVVLFFPIIYSLHGQQQNTVTASAKLNQHQQRQQ